MSEGYDLRFWNYQSYLQDRAHLDHHISMKPCLIWITAENMVYWIFQAMSPRVARRTRCSVWNTFVCKDSDCLCGRQGGAMTGRVLKLPVRGNFRSSAWPCYWAENHVLSPASCDYHCIGATLPFAPGWFWKTNSYDRWWSHCCLR